MEKELFVEGKKYISSKRAAKLTGYTHDYIGQLSRAGKIPGKLVGRTKFVDEEALLHYKQESEAAKKKTAQERSKKFKSGRKVPIVHGNTTKVTSTQENQKKNEKEHKNKDKSSASGLRKEAGTSFVQKDRHISNVAYALNEEEEKINAPVSSGARVPTSSLSDLPMRLRTQTKAQIVTTAFLFALVTSAFAVLSVVPTMSKELSGAGGGAQAYTSWVASGMETMTNRLLSSATQVGIEEFDSTEISGRYANDIFASDTFAEINDTTQPQKENEGIIATIRAKGKEVFTDVPPFTLVSGLQNQITKSTKYAQFEIAYVGAVMEYRFLEIGMDVKTLTKDTYEMAREVMINVTSFMQQQLAGNDNLLAATSNSAVGIFERSAISVFRSVESFKDALTALFSANVGTFTAPQKDRALNERDSYEDDTLSSGNRLEFSDSTASSHEEQEGGSHTQNASTTLDEGNNAAVEDQNAASTTGSN